MGGVFGSGSIADYIQSLERLKGLNSKILLSGHGRLSDTPQDDVRIAIAALARAAGRHRATVRRARRALEFRADHAVGARPQQARRRLERLPPFDKRTRRSAQKQPTTKPLRKYNGRECTMKLYDSIGPNPHVSSACSWRKKASISRSRPWTCASGENRQEADHLKRNPHGPDADARTRRR